MEPSLLTKARKWCHGFNQSGSMIYATNGNSTISAVTRIRTEGLGITLKTT